MKLQWGTMTKSAATVFLMATMLVAGCNSSTGSNAGQTNGNTSATPAATNQTAGSGEKKDLIIALGAEAKSLDPQDATDNISYDVTTHIYDNLVTFGDNMEIVPALATEWKVSDDQKEITFKLREGVKFHDGAPFNAEAVKTNFDRITNKDNKFARYSLYGPLIDSITVKGEYEVTFRLQDTYGAFLFNLAHPSGGIISPKAIAELGKKVNKNPVGTGPFKFKSWTPGDSLAIEPFDGYWGDKPQVKSVVFKPVPENAARSLMLETGEADIVFPVPAIDVERLKGNDKVNVTSYPSTRTVYVGMNTQKAPFNNVKVRQALNYAIDKESIVKKILMGNGKVSEAALGEKTFGYAAVGAYPYDPEKAKQLLSEAGVQPGTKIKLWTPDGRYLMDRQTAEFVQANLQALGFTVEFQKWEWGAYLDAVTDPNSGFDLFLLGWNSSTNDPDWGMRPFLTGDSNNYALYSNPKLDEVLKKGGLTANQEERKKIYAEALAIVKEDAPWIFLHELSQPVGMQKSVEGVKAIATELIDVRKAIKK